MATSIYELDKYGNNPRPLEALTTSERDVESEHQAQRTAVGVNSLPRAARRLLKGFMLLLALVPLTFYRGNAHTQLRCYLSHVF